MRQPAQTSRVTPPWDLTGKGYTLLYRFDRDFIEQYGFIPPHLEGKFKGGIGSIMLIDYRTSPVGAYQELLFIPGVFEHERKRYYAITKIFVSTVASLTNGRENWGIPKELADFDFAIEEGTTFFNVSQNANVFLHAELTAGLLRFPFNTRVNPFPWLLLQHHDEHGLLSIKPQAGGVIGPTAELTNMGVLPTYFPDVSTQRPLGVMELINLRLFFPNPKPISS